MIKGIRLCCIGEDSMVIYRKSYVAGDVNSTLLDYFNFLKEQVGLDAAPFTIEIEVETNTQIHRNVVGHYIFGNGQVVPVDIGVMRLVRSLRGS